jgi:hypothetical protein
VVDFFSSVRAMDDPAPFQLAERVAEAARKLGIETALIGAIALAAHNYVRGTDDVDLAVAVDRRTVLRGLEQALIELGLHAELRMPADQDDLGGVLGIWEHEDADGRPLDLVEVVNFHNPYRPKPNPAKAAIENALRLDERTHLKYVRLADLVALKLYAGSRTDLADVCEVLARNPDADLEEIRRVAKPYDAAGELERLIAEAALQASR